MNHRAISVAILSLLLAVTGFSAERHARYLKVTSVLQEGAGSNASRDPMQYSDTLEYGQMDSLAYVWSIPSPEGFGDTYYNVRFTPPVDTFAITGAIIPLFDLNGTQGSPSMRVIIWSSGEIAAEPGYPSEAIDSVTIPNEDLVFSSYQSEQLLLRNNYIDLSSRHISFTQATDFHIGVDVVNTTPNDTLVIFSDSGDPEFATDRSVLWDGQSSVWRKIRDIKFYKIGKLPFNYCIKAIISTPNGVPIVLDPSTNVPSGVSILASYPNPFNDRTFVNYVVKRGVPFTVSLFDANSRLVRMLGAGTGQGSEAISVDGSGLPAGNYFIMINTPGQQAVRQIQYLK